MPKTILLGILVLTICSAFSVRGQSVFIVDRLTDTGEGEGFSGDLRYCLTQATEGATITSDVRGVINLTRALPELTQSISIEGPGANLLTVRRSTGGDYRIFTISRAIVNISGLTIANGRVEAPQCSSPGGGGIYNDRGTLTISNSTISGNLAGGELRGGCGGGIYNSGTLTVSNSTISGNQAGPYSSGADSDGYGGGVYNLGILTVSNSTISGNEVYGSLCSDPSCGASAFGGGVYNLGTLIVSNSTISNNLVESSSTAWGGGIFQGGSLYMRNTILAGNRGYGRASDLDGRITSSGYNLIGDTRDGSGFDVTDLLNVNPRLGPLQDNGGPTLTRALLPGSPAIDAGDNTDAPEFDQRGEGYARIVNDIIDIGAFEVQKAADTTGQGSSHGTIK